MTRASRRRPGVRGLAPALALLTALAVAGCSGEDPVRDADAPAEPSAAPTLEIEPTTGLGRVTGALPRREAKLVEQRVSRIAVRYLTDAYVGGRYPRERFDSSFADFTRGARAAARSDVGVLSNARIGSRVDAVTPTRIDVTVDVLAVGKRAVGATARVRTAFRTAGRAAGRHRVSGRLLLTRDGGRWTVFGYHVSNAGSGR